jgi:hypothetical protein
VARFLQVEVQLAFGFTPTLADGPHLLCVRVTPIF